MTKQNRDIQSLLLSGEAVEIPYVPRKVQAILHKSLKRWSVVIAHRRFGKTIFAIVEGLTRALEIQRQNPRVAYIAPTYKMAKNIAWDYLKHYSKNIPSAKSNESELKIDLPNGGRFQLFGADNPDSLRGMYFDYVILDEYAMMPSNLFSEIIRPSLSDRPGGALFIGTLKSKRDQLSVLYKKLKGVNTFKISLPVSETKILPDEELKDARQSMTEEEYLQEYECIPMDFVKGSYYGEMMRVAQGEGRITTVEYDRMLPVSTVWDLGVSDDTAIGFFQMAREPRMIDYYHNSGYGLDHYIEVLSKKGYIYGRHIAPHDIEVRELSSGKSRREIARTLGINFDICPNIPLKDGIDAARLSLRTLWIDEKRCTHFIDSVLQYRREWNDKKGCFSDNPLHDWTSHGADVLRYYAVATKFLQPSRISTRIIKRTRNKHGSSLSISY